MTCGTKPVINPEYRLQHLPRAALIVPIGLLVYEWIANYRIHWIVPIMGTLIAGIGFQFVYIAMFVYLVDAFDIYSLCKALGLGWGSLLAFITLALVPVAVFFIMDGESMLDIEK
ncbi:hypothetical protein F4802DRAFT_590479 [Xylaria palmicola]|nr:hypothetical protein F4802DRAFT_590479 [Xylaria palmicola]